MLVSCNICLYMYIIVNRMRYISTSDYLFMPFLLFFSFFFKILLTTSLT